MNTKQQGFTLIELVVVIVILGILAAVAVPKFISLQGDARYSVLQGVEASVRGVSALVHAKALATGATAATGTLPAGSVEGIAGTVALAYGYPATSAINGLLNLSGSGFGITTAGTVQMSGAGTPANCQIVYAEPTAAGTVPAITVTGSATGCL
jgi:MSHA pilin protein MshA